MNQLLEKAKGKLQKILEKSTEMHMKNDGVVILHTTVTSPIQLDVNAKLRKIKQCQIQPIVKLKRASRTESQQIPSKSEAVIWAEIDEDYGPNKLWIIEVTKESKPNLLIGKNLAMTRQDKRVPVRVLNECKLPIKLSKGTILGHLERYRGSRN